jgi:hypothetical protein
VKIEARTQAGWPGGCSATGRGDRRARVFICDRQFPSPLPPA